MATEDDKPNSGLIGTITIAGAISMVAICAVVTALVRAEQAAEDERKNAHANLKPIAELRAEQERALSAAPRWVDQEKGRIGLPLDRAMGLVVKEIAADPATATPAGAEPAPVGDAGVEASEDAGAEGVEGAGATPTEKAEPGEKAAPSEEPAPEKEPESPAPTAD